MLWSGWYLLLVLFPIAVFVIGMKDGWQFARRVRAHRRAGRT